MGNHRNSSLIKHTVSIFAVLTVVVISILLAFAAVAPSSHRRGPPVESKSAIQSYAPQAPSLIAFDSNLPTAFVGRQLFPFSVVPGGVASPQELINAMGKDPLVARHYAGFDARAAHVVMLREDLRAYVSYRIGGEIFWTKTPVTLRKSETVITDGNVEARTRCGNRVSTIPQLPISAHEPEAKAFEESRNPEIATLPMDLYVLRPLPIPVPVENYFGGESAFLGEIPPLIWEPIPPIIPPPPPVPPPPPINTPASGAALFLSLDLAAAWLLNKVRGDAG